MLASGVWAVISFAGCDPVISIGGTNFPDWLICLIGGAALAALLRPLLLVLRLERYLRPLVIFYSSLIILFALSAWLIFFNRH
ncbi:MAG TPA: YtcA family lipoprotein [Candidatus Binataceae bacterium]|nr:YtcA family lipoprotein [Candidatus Binataceae bacterium]